MFTHQNFLLLLLSMTAGSVDSIGFLGLGGLFAAHITGNIVILSAHLVTGKFSQISPLLAVPIFMIVLGFVTAFAAHMKKKGVSVLLPLLVLQLILLIGSLFLSIIFGPFNNMDSAVAVTTGMLAVSAMAAQSATVKSALKKTPSTVAMTNNLTQLTLDLTFLVHERKTSEQEKQPVKEQAIITISSLLGFVIGCGFGATLQVLFGLKALLFPTTLALLCIVWALKIKNGTD
ncbi:MAG TPA: DUF1275 family protein [Candidatus Berkiella sp.]|nr:DUF1275 family protein [Candidatus Berkiella sp.]